MEMQIKQGLLFVRVMTGEITDNSIIPHTQSPTSTKVSALFLFLCLLNVSSISKG